MVLAAAETEDRWALCPPVVDTRASQIPPFTAAPGATQATADEAFAEADNITRLRGDVIVQRDQATLLGDTAEYFRNEDRLLLQGNVSYRADGLWIESDRAQLLLGEQSGFFDNTRFHIPDAHAFGSADRIQADGPKHILLSSISYTTCDPGQPDWELKAKELNLDKASNTGEAWHASLSFKGVPFFYSPYLNFPLEGRKSGLLPPTFGTSELNGTDFSLPVYWNIAPNQDATFTPRYISKRGSMMMGEYRLLTQNTHGRINAGYLNDDKLTDEDRDYLSVSHHARISRGWQSEMVFRRTSDNDFFTDELGGNEESGSQTHLERRADLTYTDRYWRFLARTQDFQTLSGTSPYQRLPQLRLDGSMPERRNRLRFALESEAVSFRHDTLAPTGERVDVKPSVSLPLGAPAWFLKPSLAWRHTQYQLDDYGPGETFERSQPIGSLDSGLFFERALELGDRPYIQTLEPRLFYLNVPYENQDDLPLFDTGELDFSFRQLFSDNRFSGADRQADTEQITLALTSRLLDNASGKERLRAAIGRIYYFRDRQVTLTGTEPDLTRESSDIIGELSLSPSDSLTMRLTEQWNPEEERFERLNGRLRYSPAQRKVLNMGYRYNREDALHQADVAMFWPVTRQLRVLGRYQYDLGSELSLDTIGGVEYESCCWSVRLLQRARRNSIDDELNHSTYLTLELKGLAGLGRSLEESTERGILGYD
ncbi:MAG: LPS assembly protein LptD [Pseudomonadota bacterium]